MISHNLKPLIQCHLIQVRQKGKERIYSVNATTIHALFKVVEGHIANFCVQRCLRLEKETQVLDTPSIT